MEYFVAVPPLWTSVPPRRLKRPCPKSPLGREGGLSDQNLNREYSY